MGSRYPRISQPVGCVGWDGMSVGCWGGPARRLLRSIWFQQFSRSRERSGDGCVLLPLLFLGRFVDLLTVLGAFSGMLCWRVPVLTYSAYL